MNVLEVAGKQFGSGKAHTQEQRAAIWKAVDSARGEAVEPLQREAAKFIKRMGADVIETLNQLTRKSEHGFTLEELLVALDIDLWERDMRVQLEPFLVSIMGVGFTVGAARVLFAGAFDVTAAEAATALSNSVSQIVTVPGTFFDSISTVIKNGLDSNATLADITKNIRGVTDRLSQSQAERIARTSGGGSFEAGQQQAYRDAGIKKHEWLSSRDAKVRDSHAMIDGEVVEIGEPFSNGLDFPLDPSGSASEVINCRCTSAPVLEEDKRRAMHDFEPPTSTSGETHALAPARRVPLKDEQAASILKDVQALPCNGRKRLEVWREGRRIRTAEITRGRIGTH